MHPIASLLLEGHQYLTIRSDHFTTTSRSPALLVVALARTATLSMVDNAEYWFIETWVREQQRRQWQISFEAIQQQVTDALTSRRWHFPSYHSFPLHNTKQRVCVAMAGRQRRIVLTKENSQHGDPPGKRREQDRVQHGAIQLDSVVRAVQRCLTPL